MGWDVVLNKNKKKQREEQFEISQLGATRTSLEDTRRQMVAGRKRLLDPIF